MDKCSRCGHAIIAHTDEGCGFTGDYDTECPCDRTSFSVRAADIAALSEERAELLRTLEITLGIAQDLYAAHRPGPLESILVQNNLDPTQACLDAARALIARLKE